MTDWPVRSLGEVCDFVRGVTYDKADARSEMKSGFIPLLRATNITEKGLLRDDFVFIPKNGVRADQKLISGDALITIASGSASVVGRSVLVEDPGEMTFGAFCGVLRPSLEILPRYLSHFMSSRSVRAAWSEAAQGTNINNLKRDDILQTECLLPPLEEQKKIVELLDAATERVTELTACYEQARTHANNLFTSALRDALESNPDWPVKVIGDVCELSLGKMLDSKQRTGLHPTPYLRNVNVRWGSIDTRDMSSMDIRPEEMDRVTANPGDVIVCEGGEPGRCAVWRGPGRIAIQKALHRVRPKTEIDADYVALFLAFLAETGELEYFFTGTTIKHIPKEKLHLVPIPLPPLKEQKQIVARLDSMKAKTSEMVAAYDAKLTAAKNLRQSVLEAAFAGAL